MSYESFSLFQTIANFIACLASENIEISTSQSVDDTRSLARSRASVFRKIDLALTRRNHTPPPYRGDSILDCVLTTGIKLTGSHYSQCAHASKHADRRGGGGDGSLTRENNEDKCSGRESAKR